MHSMSSRNNFVHSSESEVYLFTASKWQTVSQFTQTIHGDTMKNQYVYISRWNRDPAHQTLNYLDRYRLKDPQIYIQKVRATKRRLYELITSPCPNNGAVRRVLDKDQIPMN
ncbi:hypothetical protein B5X24_HaOG215409 [Helicoverpa armigera]|nr:hypothetical protein B5X24_HaOG215409 [Helicoverpa armigera]